MTEHWVSSLVGMDVPSDVHAGVTYRLEQLLDEGGMGVAFYASRRAPDGVTPAVLKVVRPEIVSSAGATASLMVRKEAIALGRLNERVPPTPFVVRFLDTGQVAVGARRRVELPWIAVEYVHGGAEGTTLEQRVRYSVHSTGYAFDGARAASAIEALAEGLTAIHEVGVIHRDLTPGNILCCGFGRREILKIADFGVARPAGVTATFGNVMLGTPGYSPPEQTFASDSDMGPWSDVFSFACVVYFLLTGEDYFEASTMPQAFMLARDGARRGLREADGLSPELRESQPACEAIDLAIARATSVKPSERPPGAHLFASNVLSWLRSLAPRSQRASQRLVASVLGQDPSAAGASDTRDWSWTVRHPPGDDRLIWQVAWDGDAHCLGVTTEGLMFYNGTGWAPASTQGVRDPHALRFVRTVRPGLWMLGGLDGSLLLYGSEGVSAVIPGPSGLTASLGSGDPDDLAVVIANRTGEPPRVHSVAARRFFRPVVLEAVSTVTALARVDETQWLLTGRTVKGTGFAALYSPLTFEITHLMAPPTDALTACAGHIDRGMGLTAGRQGVTLSLHPGGVEAIRVGGRPDLASAAMDVHGRCWVGGAGRLWTRCTGNEAPWQSAWHDSSWSLPFVSLQADVGVVRAMTVDGAVIEGRAPRGPSTAAS